ncbi:hypothetical protein PSN45_002236 [Yamadazyma tenuis]|uniref:Nitrogen regulatory protein areA GATA-like domain-containing protein n=1 Tax=Candida tenuis (strain ATCC 10573 / BCRC 21748 / CBS 615 / JCM 9827 / NBRC 10315 / NRRL Y-1498 / VKM Y-70) TaxID=590646 RepID=G3BFD4_CANTC|nr:uncharacterized protein CANTEDRAFT_116050 [Yamadazyma tenuis ATCC 10573]XP_006690204.1 uncharacterized protein CANTEDRAFT_116050 [Yamadazyma tenuis ATCC 10573]EGV60989.1 hypothetical protein CANTEDRAFT_116050 [Yamadazyma tenuis ATCC 10573]EGV60990.1 hypothetical protein CANTEDRAFT_116050 [Yamadazyma tenuis ATCC 10573]WEJ94741.1 hypothetical protein PSN45_002236 [Yamadazyma tenuis]
MNCFDDSYISHNLHSFDFTHNIDYLDDDTHIPDEVLIKCYKQSKYDISIIIPSTAPLRLQNIAWRRLYKSLRKLPEVSPRVINWHKQLDINWCFGPSYSHEDLITPPEKVEVKAAPIGIPDAYPLLYTVSNSSSDTLTDSDSLLSNSPTSTCSSHSNLSVYHGMKKKRVKFNFIVNSREIINGISIDYDFLDDSILND